VPTIDGKVRIKLEAGIQPGTVRRLSGKGLPRLNQYGRGDLLVNISIYVPEKLSKEETQMLQKLAESKNFAPNDDLKSKIFKKFRSWFG
jgi:molecular chaperone DnaJ